MHSADNLVLMRRSAILEIGQKLIDRIHWWEEYTARNDKKTILPGAISAHRIMGRKIFFLFIRVTSGQETKSESPGFGGADFVPWQMSVVM
jgi:altronate dehydratase